MNYLIDTHILLWSFFAVEKLSKNILGIFFDEKNTIFYSSVSLLEISIKYSIGKLNLNHYTPETFFEKLNKTVLMCKPISNYEIASFYKLPIIGKHKDPFDRLLIWQAMQNNITLLSNDSNFSEYVQYGLKLEG